MDMQFKDRFTYLWNKYFPGNELPLTYYYTSDTSHAKPADPAKTTRCVIEQIVKARKGLSFTLSNDSVHCEGAKRFFGFTDTMGEGNEEFLSYGVPGKLEGERLKKTPETVKAFYANYAPFTAPAPYVVFKRWDKLEETDTPEVVMFFVKPNVLAGLYNLANYDMTVPDGVIAPWGSGCSSIMQEPYLQKDAPDPRAVLGVFDITARYHVGAGELSFSVPLKKLVTMTENMEESFLITHEWQGMMKRLESE